VLVQRFRFGICIVVELSWCYIVFDFELFMYYTHVTNIV